MRCMRTLLTLLAAFAFCALLPAESRAGLGWPPKGPPTPGVTLAFVAYGEGTTACTVTLTKRTGQDLNTVDYGTRFSGRTECTTALPQTARATVPSDGSAPALDGGLCSATTTVCSSGGNLNNLLNTQPLTYRITLRAPLGQGWVGAPNFCSGVGTDNLKCDFVVNDVAIPVDTGDTVPTPPSPGEVREGIDRALTYYGP